MYHEKKNIITDELIFNLYIIIYSFIDFFIYFIVEFISI